MGADGYTWGRDYIDIRDESHPLYIRKMWYMFSIWGLQSYNINLSKDYFRRELDSHFEKDTSILYETWGHASKIVPILNQVHWHNYDFQWYPEGCCMYDFEFDKLILQMLMNLHVVQVCQGAIITVLVNIVNYF